ncbi:hypothetical protein ACFFHP_04555 [Glutamicibacter ardleyensis]|uniref:hypothetical protein n=1 Tax=Glutamicibacter ardleyensis TaxID=225894 RepID=UPI00166963CA
MPNIQSRPLDLTTLAGSFFGQWWSWALASRDGSLGQALVVPLLLRGRERAWVLFPYLLSRGT